MKSLILSSLMLSAAMLGVAPALAQSAAPADAIKGIVLAHGALSTKPVGLASQRS